MGHRLLRVNWANREFYGAQGSFGPRPRFPGLYRGPFARCKLSDYPPPLVISPPMS